MKAHMDRYKPSGRISLEKCITMVHLLLMHLMNYDSCFINHQSMYPMRGCLPTPRACFYRLLRYGFKCKNDIVTPVVTDEAAVPPALLPDIRCNRKIKRSTLFVTWLQKEKDSLQHSLQERGFIYVWICRGCITRW